MQEDLKNLKCPECGAKVSFTTKDQSGKLVIVFFSCAFSATFDSDTTSEEAQKRLDEFKSSGKLKEWAEKPLF